MGSTVWIFCFVMFFSAFWQSEAAVFQAIGNNTDNDGCIVGSKKYKPGQDWYEPGECIRYSCHSNRGDYSGASCGKTLVDDGCRLLPGDDTKNYPDCCPRKIVCPGDDGF